MKRNYTVRKTDEVDLLRRRERARFDARQVSIAFRPALFARPYFGVVVFERRLIPVAWQAGASGG